MLTALSPTGTAAQTSACRMNSEKKAAHRPSSSRLYSRKGGGLAAACSLPFGSPCLQSGRFQTDKMGCGRRKAGIKRMPWATEENVFKIRPLFSFSGSINLSNFRNKITRYSSTLQLSFLDFP